MNAVYKSAGITTLQLANELAMEAQSIRKRYSETGSYFNVRPSKLPNGRLRWPQDSVTTLLNIGNTNTRSTNESDVESKMSVNVLSGGK